jgi:hypothetical protein
MPLSLSMSLPTFWLLSLVSPHLILPSLTPPPIPTNVLLKKNRMGKRNQTIYVFLSYTLNSYHLTPPPRDTLPLF